jgi:UMF1 family MFS transporter
MLQTEEQTERQMPEGSPDRPMRAEPLSIGAWSWVIYEACKLPYVLMSVYLVVPYVSRVLIGNGVRGQATVAGYAALAGALAAVTLPVIGGSLDRLGRRKPWIAVFAALRVPLLAALWWAMPDGTGLPVRALLVILALVSLLSHCSEMMHTALLVPAVGMRRSGRFSGVSLGIANIFSVAVLLFMLCAFVLPGRLSWPGIPAAPLFGIDQAAHEPERLVGPVSAALLVLGTLPLLLFATDVPRSEVGFFRSVGLGLRDTWQLARSLRHDGNLRAFLFARTLFNDGFLAGLAFAGVYAAGVMRWGPLELLSYGILKAIFAALGAFIAGELNALLGPRRAVKLELTVAILLGFLVLGTTREEILFVWSDPTFGAPLWSGPMFRTLPELVYLIVSLCASAFAVACLASFRALVVRLIAVEQTGAYLSLVALTSSTTAWIVPLAVSVLTAYAASQRVGVLPISFFLLASLMALQFVSGGERLSDRPATRAFHRLAEERRAG